VPWDARPSNKRCDAWPAQRDLPMLCYAMLCYATLRYATLRYATLRYHILSHILCYPMLSYARRCSTRSSCAAARTSSASSSARARHAPRAVTPHYTRVSRLCTSVHRSRHGRSQACTSASSSASCR
jgi:hypothetical protein